MTTPTGKQSAAHTPGPYHFHDTEDLIVVAENGKAVADFNSKAVDDAEERWGNGRLFIEAGTVAHETGMTPRQLADEVENLRGIIEMAELSIPQPYLEQMDEYLQACKAARAEAKKGSPNPDKIFNILEAVITKAEAVTA